MTRPAIVTELLAELRRDPGLRDEVVSLLGEGVATKADVALILERLAEQGRTLEQQGRTLEEQGRRLEQQGRTLEEQGRRLEQQGQRLEQQGERLEQHSRVLERLVEAVENQGRRIEEAFRRVEALGARWGLHSESAFREGMRAVLARRLAGDVRRWEGFDPEGVVFGRPTSIELDVVVRNGGTLLIEIKSRVSRADLGAFHRKALLYEQQSGARAERLVVSPYVEPRALELARELGIEVSTSLEG